LSYIPITHTYHTQHITNNTTTHILPHHTQQHNNTRTTSQHTPATQPTTTNRKPALCNTQHHIDRTQTTTPATGSPTHTHTHTSLNIYYRTQTNHTKRARETAKERPQLPLTHGTRQRTTHAGVPAQSPPDRRRQTDGDRPRLRQRRPIPPTGRWLSQHRLASVS